MRQRGVWRSGIALGALVASLAGGLSAQAQVQVPIQVTPYASEPGVPAVTISPTNPLAGDSDPTGTGTGTGTGTSTGSTGGTGTSSDALDTMLSQTWGASAVSNAEAV
ncbi:MAG: hypothetical protein KGH75_01130, partial [Rhodospirillales bacterium]|nr:hypothetical protein [Rhodospirillales bacterium]